MFGWFGFRKHHREQREALPFPSDWLTILRDRVPYYHRLTPSEQEELQGDIRVFLGEKNFIGCQGLEITDEIRIAIAAQACVLLLHRETKCYPGLRTIFVYPHEFVVEAVDAEVEGVPLIGEDCRLGESWHRGPVVLSWDDVCADAEDDRDGHNVVFHEFAHQLDDEYHGADGLPRLPESSMYADWARVWSREYERLVGDVKAGRRTDIDPYGATNPAEFFAVATETFFEAPRRLKRRHPELYEQLRLYYRQDPAERY